MRRPREVRRAGHRAADIVRDAGGEVVGRTRLQKIAYLLEITGLGDGFSFEYRNYGPYSEELATAIRHADLLGDLVEQEHIASWGGMYSIYTADGESDHQMSDRRKQLAASAVRADPIALELAATAAFLAAEGLVDPWEETALRKPAKATRERIANAKALYLQLGKIGTPTPLPEIELAQ